MLGAGGLGPFTIRSDRTTPRIIKIDFRRINMNTNIATIGVFFELDTHATWDYLKIDMGSAKLMTGDMIGASNRHATLGMHPAWPPG